MRALETRRAYLEPFLRNPHYVERRTRRRITGYVGDVWVDSSALTATIESVAAARGVTTVDPVDEGFYEGLVLERRARYKELHRDRTASLVVDLRAQRVPRSVTTDVVAGTSWESPMNRTPFEPRMQRLGGIVDYIAEVGEEIPR